MHYTMKSTNIQVLLCRDIASEIIKGSKMLGIMVLITKNIWEQYCLLKIRNNDLKTSCEQNHHYNVKLPSLRSQPGFLIARETVFIVKKVCYEHLTERHNNCLVANTRSIKIFTDACHIVKDRLESYIRNTARCTLGSSWLW